MEKKRLTSLCANFMVDEVTDITMNDERGENNAETAQAAQLLCLFAQVTDCLHPSSKKRSFTEINAESTPNTEEYGHDAQGAYKCDVFNCNYATRKASALAAHKMRTHGKKEVFPCSYCGEVFTLSDTRNKHIKRKHTQEKSYQCAICDKKFFTKQELDNHFNSRHTCSQKLKCANCDLTFTTIRTLNVHQKKQHGIKQFKCEKCELSFAYRYELHNHRCKKLKDLNSIVANNNKTIMPLNLQVGLYGPIQSLPSNAAPTTSYHAFSVNDLSYNVTALPVN